MIIKQKRMIPLSIVLIVLLFCLSVPAHSAVILSDDFDDGTLDPAWAISFQSAADWSYAEEGTELTVSDIAPTVINPGGGGTWALVTISRDIVPVNDFSVDFEFSWDSEDPATGFQDKAAAQNLYLALYDDTGTRIVLTGIHDAWSAWSGEKYAHTNMETFASGFNSLPFLGSASISVSRSGSNMVVSWDGVTIASGTAENLLKTVRISFYYYGSSSSFFGTESVDLIQIEDASLSNFDNELYYPHIASDSRWETEICAINTSSKSIAGIFKAYNDAGEFSSEDIAVTLASHARKEITVGDEFANPSDIGYIIFESDSENIIGYTKFYIDGQYRVAVPAISDITTGDLYISHIASDDKWWTGVSIVNTTSLAKNLTIEFDDGTTKMVDLAGKEHKAFNIKSLFNNASQPDLNSAVIKNADDVIGLELFSKGNQLSGILLKNDTTQDMYYPHIASNDKWWTGTVAYNPSTSFCTLTVKPYTSAGTPLATKAVPLGGQEKYIGSVKDLDLPADSAWFHIEATKPITGFELFGTSDGTQLAGYTGVNISSKEGLFAKIDKEGWTGIAFVNIGSSETAVELTAYDDSGALIATESITLDPYEKIVNNPKNIFSANISSATYLSYSSDNELVGFQLNGSSDGMMLDGLPGLFVNGTNSSLDISGVWDFVYTITAADGVCTGEAGSIYTDRITIVQTGSAITLSGFAGLESNVLTGSINGDQVQFDGSKADEGGTTITDHNGTASETTMSLIETWSWSGPEGSCPNGSATVVATKVP